MQGKRNSQLNVPLDSEGTKELLNADFILSLLPRRPTVAIMQIQIDSFYCFNKEGKVGRNFLSYWTIFLNWVNVFCVISARIIPTPVDASLFKFPFFNEL